MKDIKIAESYKVTNVTDFKNFTLHTIIDDIKFSLWYYDFKGKNCNSFP
jgi:hypothetical protein